MTEFLLNPKVLSLPCCCTDSLGDLTSCCCVCLFPWGPQDFTSPFTTAKVFPASPQPATECPCVIYMARSPCTHAYGFRPHKGVFDAATVLTLLVELAQALGTPLVGSGTDYTKCFVLIPQAISMAVLEVQGINEVVLRAFCLMYSQLWRIFKIKGFLGAWWRAATNGSMKCHASVIYYYTPLPLNSANKQQATSNKQQATSNKQQATSTSPFRFSHCPFPSPRP